MSNEKKQTVLDEFLKQIQDEINFTKHLNEDETIRGRKAGLSFAALVALALKEMEKERMIEFAEEYEKYCRKLFTPHKTAKEFFETYGNNE